MNELLNNCPIDIIKIINSYVNYGKFSIEMKLNSTFDAMKNFMLEDKIVIVNFILLNGEIISSGLLNK